jgi:kumamolisin
VTWDQTGGGPSAYESRPSYQNGISTIVGSQRGTPDIAAVANPETAVWVYDSFPYYGETGPWWLVGGTSVASPLVAGVVNAAGSFMTSSAAELASIYSSKARRDIHSGSCGYYEGYPSVTGWDFCTGVGVPIAGGN